MRLQQICEEILEEVDGALGCALVDLETGLPLALRAASDTLHESGAIEILCAASADYFRGEVNHQLETALGGDRSSEEGFVEEIQTTTDETYLFMCVVPDNSQAVLLLITDKTANLGLGWVAVRGALRRLGALARRPAADDAPQHHPAATDSPDPQPQSGSPMNGNAHRGPRSRRRARSRL